MKVVHYCPYCGDEDLWPLEGHGQWRCRACTRTFAVRIVTDQEQQ
jgi:ribosomal protein L37AE/L43A